MSGKRRSYHFDVGNSNEGPIGFCARVNANSKKEAVNIVNDALASIGRELEQDRNFWDGAGSSDVEYINVYFNPKGVTVKNIDEVD